jgi:ankyrin repeat protein
MSSEASTLITGPDSPLNLAARRDEAAELLLLLQSGEDPVARTGARGATPLIEAAIAGSVSCVRLLLPFSDLSARDNFGRTALVASARCHKAECVRLLLDAGSDPLAVDRDGWSALMWAADDGLVEVFKLLLPLSDLEVKDTFGQNALAVCALRANEIKTRAFVQERCRRQAVAERETLAAAANSGHADGASLGASRRPLSL